MWTASFLVYLAWLLWRKGRAPGAKPSLIRPLIVYYILACPCLAGVTSWEVQGLTRSLALQITAVVEITRLVWDVSRFALVTAALHNLAGALPCHGGSTSPALRPGLLAQSRP